MEDLSNKRFNNFVVVSFSHTHEYPSIKRYKDKKYNYITKKHYWNCQCDCGKKFISEHFNLQRPIIKGCGCHVYRTKEQFIEYVKNLPTTETGCKIWPKSKRPNGYSYTTYKKKQYGVHRLSYIFFKGPIEKGKYICHSCDHRQCVEPSHLWAGTCKDNMEDCKRKKRTLYGEKGTAAKLTEEKVIEIRSLRKKKITLKELSKKFNVHFSTIWDICNYKSWKHLGD